jgi:hypothetical protein
MFLELNKSEIDENVDYDDYIKQRSDWIFLSSETIMDKPNGKYQKPLMIGTHDNPYKLAKSIIKNRKRNKEYKKKLKS